MPVVLIFTKFDALEVKCYSKLREQGKNHEDASIQVLELANKTLQEEYLPRVLDAEFPPKTYVCLAGNMLHSDTIILFNSHGIRNGQGTKSML